MKKHIFIVFLLSVAVRIMAQETSTVPQPVNVETKQVGNSLVISWQKPDGVDEADITYNVYNKAGDAVATGLTETSYTDSDLVLTGKQLRVYYRVSATVNSEESDKVRSTGVVVGEAYTLPFHESFDKKNPSGYFWWGDNSGWSSFAISDSYTVDDEYGAMVLYLYDKGDKSTINTGKISLSGTDNPALMFSQGLWAGYDMQMNVYVTTPDGTKTLLKNYNYMDYSDRGWGREVLSLSDYKNEEYIMINFEPTANTTEMPFVIDNIYVIEYLKYNLQAKVSAPKNGAIGTESMVTIKVTNLGQETAKGYKVHLYKDGELFETVTDASNIPTYYDLARFFYVMPTLTDPEVMKFTAVVDYTPDMDTSDNESGPVEMPVNQPSYPYVNTLTGYTDQNGRVVLEWQQPEIGESEQMTDTFDNYDAWIAGGIGAWKTVDNDYAFTYGIDGIKYEHEGEPMSFLVFNPSSIGINVENNPEFAPHSGKQYLVCMAAVGSQAPEGHNDDWLISPLIADGGQTIDFYARAMSAKYKERFEVYYSTESNEIEDFKLLNTVDGVPTEWTNYAQALPEDAQYFAIRVTSADAYGLMLDDISYTPANLEIENYNVYCDNKIIALVPNTQQTYTDMTVNGTHKYRVGVVYNAGESRLSNTVELQGSTAIETVEATDAADTMLTVYSLSGEMVAAGKNILSTLPRGIYIVKDNNTGSVSKMTVK